MQTDPLFRKATNDKQIKIFDETRGNNQIKFTAYDLFVHRILIKSHSFAADNLKFYNCYVLFNQ